MVVVEVNLSYTVGGERMTCLLPEMFIISQRDAVALLRLVGRAPSLHRGAPRTIPKEAARRKIHSVGLRLKVMLTLFLLTQTTLLEEGSDLARRSCEYHTLLSE